MSWSIQFKNMPAARARDYIQNSYAPYVVKYYLDRGVEALQRKYKDKDVAVDCNSYGHLCQDTGQGYDYEVTSATIDIRKTAEAVAEKEPEAATAA